MYSFTNEKNFSLYRRSTVHTGHVILLCFSCSQKYLGFLRANYGVFFSKDMRYFDNWSSCTNLARVHMSYCIQLHCKINDFQWRQELVRFTWQPPQQFPLQNSRLQWAIFPLQLPSQIQVHHPSHTTSQNLCSILQKINLKICNGNLNIFGKIWFRGEIGFTCFRTDEHASLLTLCILICIPIAFGKMFLNVVLTRIKIFYLFALLLLQIFLWIQCFDAMPTQIPNTGIWKLKNWCFDFHKGCWKSKCIWLSLIVYQYYMSRMDLFEI